jgi:hypothetical protein
MRYVHVVDVDSGNPETDADFLEKLQETFNNVTALVNWGYTGDELLCRSHLDLLSPFGSAVQHDEVNP